jgi:hypothetical protein
MTRSDKRRLLIVLDRFLVRRNLINRSSAFSRRAIFTLADAVRSPMQLHTRTHNTRPRPRKEREIRERKRREREKKGEREREQKKLLRKKVFFSAREEKKVFTPKLKNCF